MPFTFCSDAAPLTELNSQRTNHFRKISVLTQPGSPADNRAAVADRPTPVTEGDEMLAPERPLAASGRLIEWRSETKL